MSQKIYLDYNATTPLRPSARKALMEVHDQILIASAAHSFGQKGRQLIEDSRAIIAGAINCPVTGVVFNSGATEANNTVLQYFARTYPDDRILIGATEHAAVQEVVPDAQRIPVDKNGVTDLDKLEEILKEQPRVSIVSVMLANNETGAIQPIKEIAALAHEHGALFHSDAIQGYGKIPIDMEEMGIDFLSLSAHKNGGTQGCGTLAIGSCGVTPVLIFGGGHEKGARAGTHNISGIAAFAASTTEAMEKLETENKRLSDLRAYMEKELLKISPDAVIFSKDVQRLPNTTLFSVPGFKAETLLMNLDLEGIAVSNGAACSSGTVKQSRILDAMNVPRDLAEGALRISTGWNTSEEDIDHFLKVWQNIYSRMKEKEKRHA